MPLLSGAPPPKKTPASVPVESGLSINSIYLLLNYLSYRKS